MRTHSPEGLDLQVRLGYPTCPGVHNKMVLARIDGRGYFHAGRINDSEGSSKVNRELALQIQAGLTTRTVDLSAYKVGDAAYPDDNEAKGQFPPGTAIPPRGILDVVVTATCFRGKFRTLSPGFEIFDSHPAVPNLQKLC